MGTKPQEDEPNSIFACALMTLLPVQLIVPCVEALLGILGDQSISGSGKFLEF